MAGEWRQMLCAEISSSVVLGRSLVGDGYHAKKTELSSPRLRSPDWQRQDGVSTTATYDHLPVEIYRCVGSTISRIRTIVVVYVVGHSWHSCSLYALPATAQFVASAQL